MAFTSLTDLLAKQSLRYGNDRSFLFFGDGEEQSDCRTFLELAERAKTIGSFLLGHHNPGDVIFLPFTSSLEFIDAFFGVIYAGMVAVPSPAVRIKRKDSRNDAIIEDAQPVCILQASTDQADKIREHYANENIPVYSIEEMLGREVCVIEPVFNSLAYLQYTSGSTSQPKGVEISHENVLDNCMLIGDSIRFNSGDTVVTWLPHFHDMGLVGGIVIPVFHALTTYMMPPVSFIQRPQRWLNLISKNKASVSVAPNFAYDLCERKIQDEEIGNMDLSNWRAALNGSEPIVASSLERFIARFEKYGFRKNTICGSYGMAEATLAVTIQSPENEPFFTFDKECLRNGKLKTIAAEDYINPDKKITLVACGGVNRQIDVKIVNPETLEICDEGDVGEILVNGGSVARGYWRNRKATLETFEVHIADKNERTYLRTGDSGGFFQNELFITGRLKDILIVQGRNFFPQDIELCATQSHPVLKNLRCAVFENSNKDLVVVQEALSTEANGSYLELAETIKGHIYEEFELDVSEILFIPKKTIPLTTSGKLQRQICRVMYANNEFACLAREFPCRKVLPIRQSPVGKDYQQYVPPRDAIEFELCYLVKSVFGINDISMSDNLMDYGIASVSVVEFVEALNNKFGKSFPLSIVVSNPSIEAMAVAIRSETTSSNDSPFIVLKPGSPDKSIFCVHTIGGNPYIYYKLSQKFSDDYTVYGIQAKGLEEGEQPDESIDQMAKSYLDQIVEFSPHGNIYIIGYSSASVIAYEIAGRLQKTKRRKAFLCFIDPLSPTAIQNIRSIDDSELQFRATLGEALITSDEEWIEYWDNNREEISTLKSEEEKLSFLEKQLILAPSAFFPNFGEKRLRRFLRTYMCMYKAFRGYSPKNIFRGKIHMLRTNSGDDVRKDAQENFLGWEKYATEGIEVKNIGGEHLAVLAEPEVSNIGKIINQWLIKG